MAFREFRDEVKRAVEEALVQSSYPKIHFDILDPPRPELGDLSVNVAFQVAKKVGERPLIVAQKIGLKIDKTQLIGGFEVHEAGYLNFKIDYPEFVYRTLVDATGNMSYGALNIGRGKRVLVEHTSVNPNKALHIGHLRNVVLGDAVGRLLRFTGHDVQVLNYIDDSGSQVADIIVGFLYANIPLEPTGRQKFDHYCGDVVYVKVNELYENQPGLLDEKKNVLMRMEDSRSEVAVFSHKITKRILKDQLKTCWRVGATYDCLNFESHILDLQLWSEVFDLMKKKGIATLANSGKFRGCWIVKVEGEEEGEEKVLVRSDGTATYIAKDIPYAAWKLGIIPDRFRYVVFTQQPGIMWSTSIDGDKKTHPFFGGAEQAVTVIDVRQSRLQRIISHVLSQIIGKPIEDRYVHLGYGLVSLSSDTATKLGINAEDMRFLHMSGRKGIYINADDVLDALYAHSFEETRLRNFGEHDQWLKSTAEKVAIAAIRFDLLKQDVDKMITFDLDEALNLEGETGPYIQYAYARASRILEKAGEKPQIDRNSSPVLSNSSEISLVKKISMFDLLVEDAVTYLSPKAIARYAYSLAVDFNSFYEKNPVLQEKEQTKKLARLALVKSFCTTVKSALNLLGIETPERI